MLRVRLVQERVDVAQWRHLYHDESVWFHRATCEGFVGGGRPRHVLRAVETPAD